MPCIMYERAGVTWKAADKDWVGICRAGARSPPIRFTAHACLLCQFNKFGGTGDRWTEQIVQEVVGACALRRGLRMTASEKWEKPGD